MGVNLTKYDPLYCLKSVNDVELVFICFFMLCIWQVSTQVMLNIQKEDVFISNQLLRPS